MHELKKVFILYEDNGEWFCSKVLDFTHVNYLPGPKNLMCPFFRKDVEIILPNYSVNVSKFLQATLNV